ncbi:alpha/beta-hydrolase [Bimuria novae-zelandiae CBS 107.79]|uniref:Alpha/beta-hydrolase n=1 Tax=Bimuria novae-zelandiae CBS 107.79 TaxID=1447943 RepID=A0A6A5VZZ9_9PLEO|nr:alpha/beta-hydrolase [Bimuria novae-zelandiae CBS 107.79]
MAPEGFAKPWVEFEEEFGERPLLPYDSVEACVEGFAKIGAKLASLYTFPAPDPAVKTEDKTIEGGLKIRIYTPEGYSGGNPVGVYYHSGGWAMSDIDGDDASCRTISKGGNVVLVSVAFGLAPQNKHPGLINDCWKGLQWTLDNAKALGGIEGKFFTAGVSAGGQLAIALALKSIDEAMGESLVGVVAEIPATIHPDGVPEAMQSKYTSYTEHANNTIDTDKAMRAFWKAFSTSPTDPYGSVLLHQKIKDLKKVYLTVASHDTLRDDGLLFKQKLDDSKVPYKFDFYEGYPHYHWTWPSAKLDKPRDEYNANVAKGVQWLIS